MDTINQYTLGGEKGAKQGGKVLVNPFQVPQQIVFRATVADDSGITSLYLADSYGLGSALGLIAGSNSQTFTVDEIGAAVLRAWLTTYALVVKGYNFECSDATQLSKNLSAIYICLDGESQVKKLFSAQTVSNMQQNPNLLNVNQPFVWTGDTALKLPITAPTAGAVDFVFTIKILGAVPYGLLDSYLESMQIPDRAMN